MCQRAITGQAAPLPTPVRTSAKVLINLAKKIYFLKYKSHIFLHKKSKCVTCRGGLVVIAVALKSSKTAILLRSRLECGSGLQNRLLKIMKKYHCYSNSRAPVDLWSLMILNRVSTSRHTQMLMCSRLNAIKYHYCNYTLCVKLLTYYKTLHIYFSNGYWKTGLNG